MKKLKGVAVLAVAICLMAGAAFGLTLMSGVPSEVVTTSYVEADGLSVGRGDANTVDVEGAWTTPLGMSRVALDPSRFMLDGAYDGAKLLVLGNWRLSALSSHDIAPVSGSQTPHDYVRIAAALNRSLVSEANGRPLVLVGKTRDGRYLQFQVDAARKAWYSIKPGTPWPLGTGWPDVTPVPTITLVPTTAPTAIPTVTSAPTPTTSSSGSSLNMKRAYGGYFLIARGAALDMTVVVEKGADVDIASQDAGARDVLTDVYLCAVDDRSDPVGGWISYSGTVEMSKWISGFSAAVKPCGITRDAYYNLAPKDLVPTTPGSWFILSNEQAGTIKPMASLVLTGTLVLPAATESTSKAGTADRFEVQFEDTSKQWDKQTGLLQAFVLNVRDGKYYQASTGSDRAIHARYEGGTLFLSIDNDSDFDAGQGARVSASVILVSRKDYTTPPTSNPEENGGGCNVGFGIGFFGFLLPLGFAWGLVRKKS